MHELLNCERQVRPMSIGMARVFWQHIFLDHGHFFAFCCQTYHAKSWDISPLHFSHSCYPNSALQSILKNKANKTNLKENKDKFALYINTDITRRFSSGYLVFPSLLRWRFGIGRLLTARVTIFGQAKKGHMLSMAAPHCRVILPRTIR